MNRWSVIVPPADAVTLVEAKDNLRVRGDAENAFIAGLIRRASHHAERVTDRALGEQTLEAVLDRFPSGHLELPRGPATGIVSINYLDQAGATVPLVSAGTWELEELSDPGTIHLLGSWPAALTSPNAVRVRYTAGTGWPEEARQAVLLLVGHWFQNREAAADVGAAIPYGVDALLALHRRAYC